MKRVLHRVYSDYLHPNRLGLYREILQQLLGKGYQFYSLRDFAEASRAGRIPQRFIILRHDVDTDPRRAEAMFEIDRALGIRASYFFRLKTMRPELMRRIEDFGGEASYHYEEIADYCKQEGVTSPDVVKERLQRIREMFVSNYHRLKSETGLPFKVVAGHGDFVNRKLKIPNHLLLADEGLREELGIVAESYDPLYFDEIDEYIASAPYPVYWKPKSPLETDAPRVYILTHPRQWGRSICANAKEDLERTWEGARWRG